MSSSRGSLLFGFLYVASVSACGNGAGVDARAAGAGGQPAAAGTGAGQSHASGGSGGSNSAVSGAGGSAGAQSGGGGAGGQAGAAGGGTAGDGGSGSVVVGKGASAKAVCGDQSGFVDPTTGMGSIQEVTAPAESFFAFIEGPVWVASIQRLLFSDNAGSPERIWAFDPAGAALTKFLEASGSNGLAIDPNDQLIVADQVNRALYRLDPTTKMKVGENLVSGAFKPNDVAVRSDGVMYITDPDSGVYYVAANGMEATLATTQVNRPNGMVLTLDEQAIIIGDVGNQSLTKFALAADGSLIDTPAPFAMTTATTADGMCEDCAGNVYVGTQNGVEIFDAGGARLGTVPTGEASNCTFGGTDRKTLFVTSRATLKFVTLANPGLPN